MKIIQVTPYYPPHLGGMEQRVRELSERLANKGHEVEVFTSDLGCEKGKIKSTRNLKINYLKAWEIAHMPIIPSLFFRLMRIPKESIIHVHIAQPLIPEIAYFVSKIRGIPYICHMRIDVQKSGTLGFLLPFYKKFILKNIFKNSAGTIVLTNDFKDIVKKRYYVKENKIKVISNATSFNIRKKIKKNSKNNLKLLYVGRLSEQKNLSVLIKAISFIENKPILSIVGEGKERENISKLIKNQNLQKYIFLLGRKEGKDLINIYTKSDIFILPSREEGFSTTLLEAMTTGTAIIASDIPGTRNVIKNNYNGLLVEPTPEKIAWAMEKLINDPKLRQRLVKNGLKEVKKYSWDKIINQTEELYKQVLKNHENKQ